MKDILGEGDFKGSPSLTITFVKAFDAKA